MNTLTYTTTLAKITCGSCHIPFAIPENMHEQVQQDGALFYCPNGHQIGYRKTENQKLRDDLERAQRRAIRAENEARWASALAGAERRSAAAYRGHLTRIRNKIANGVCPVAGCRRHFDNVQDHIRGQHPEWLEQHDIELADLEAKP